MTVHLHIDHLVLDGLGPLDGDAVGAAVQAELSRLVAEVGVPGLDGDQRHALVDGGQFRLGAEAEGVGQQVARRIYGGLTR